MGERLEALLGKIKKDCELRKQWAVKSQPDAGKPIWDAIPAIRRDT